MPNSNTIKIQSSSAYGTINTTGSSITISSGSYIFNSFAPKTKYFLLEEEIEVDGNYDSTLALTISMINVNGIKLYNELLKQGYWFPKEIEEVLEKELKSYHRNKIIDEFVS